jgi:hypothetical protein
MEDLMQLAKPDPEMMTTDSHLFTGQEAAVAYALSAQRIYAEDGNFLCVNPSCVPIFVGMLYQSLEISIKQAGLESGLFSIQEARSRQQRSGHGIKELAALALMARTDKPYFAHPALWAPFVIVGKGK